MMKQYAWVLHAFTCAVLVGCAPKIAGLGGGAGAFATRQFREATAAGALLPWVGGVAILGGIVALVLTRGGMGARAIVIGVLLVILNDIMQRYATAFYVPILVGTGCVSIVYAWRTVRRAVRVRKGA